MILNSSLRDSTIPKFPLHRSFKQYSLSRMTSAHGTNKQGRIHFVIRRSFCFKPIEEIQLARTKLQILPLLLHEKTIPSKKKQEKNTVDRENVAQSTSLNIINYSKFSISLRVELKVKILIQFCEESKDMRMARRHQLLFSWRPIHN